MFKRRTVFWRYFLLHFLVTLGVVAVTVVLTTAYVKDKYLSQAVRYIESQAHLIGALVVDSVSSRTRESVDPLCKKLGRFTSIRFTVILPTGEVLGDSEEDPSKMDNHRMRPEVAKALEGGVGVSTRHSHTLKKEMVYVAVPLFREARVVGIARASLPMGSLKADMSRMEVSLLLGGLFLAGFFFALSLIVYWMIARPLKSMKEGAERFSKGELSYRLTVPKSGEMAALAETLNLMAVQLGERIKGIQRQRSELEAVLSSMAEGVIGVDMEERVIGMNPAAARLIGSSQRGSTGRSIEEVLRYKELQVFTKEMLSAGQDFMEREIIMYSGGERYINVHGSTLHDESGGRLGVLIVLNDMTRLRKLENMRREFVANVSHEIKTPITVIRGFTETLRSGAGEDKEERDRFLGIMEKNLDRLEAVVEDLLTLSRIEREEEQAQLITEDLALSDIIHNTMKAFEGMAEEKRIEVQIDCDPRIWAKLNSELMELALGNLLDNAIKYSDAGDTIRIRVDESDSEVRIDVVDQGIGISQEHLPRIFERFYRADKTRSRELGGTGLGLAIVKHVMGLHGGRVSVKSTPGQGSTFTLHLKKEGSR